MEMGGLLWIVYPTVGAAAFEAGEGGAGDELDDGAGGVEFEGGAGG